MKTILLVPAVLALMSMLGQEPAKPTPPPSLAPTLSEVDKLRVQTIAQRIQIAQLQAQAAQAAFDTAREEFAKLVTSLQKDGYELDLQSLSYRPKAAEKK